MDLFWSKPKLKDDRGELLADVGTWGRLEGLWQDREVPRRVRVMRVVPFVMVGAYLGWVLLVSGGWRLTAGEVGFFAIAVVVAQGSMWLSASRPSSRLWRMAWAPVAWLCAHRVCGACGYGLSEVEPGGDGVAVCPECGAGWHRDRWTMEGRDPREEPLLVNLVEGRGGGLRGFWVDDRGVPVDVVRGWVPRWAGEDWVPVAERREVRAKLKAVGWRRFAVGVGVTAAVYVVGVALAVWLAEPLPRDIWATLGIFGAMGGVFFVLVVFLLARLSVPRDSVRAVALGVGRCPNCGKALGEAQAGFDGCVACGRCRRAWREGGEMKDPAAGAGFEEGFGVHRSETRAMGSEAAVQQPFSKAATKSS